METWCIQLLVISTLTALTAYLSHTARAVFHDGIRPILPELAEGRMGRPEAASIAFGLSVGFIASIGLAFTLTTGLLNPWILFLPTDILGVMATRKYWALIFGGAWGALVLISLTVVNTFLPLLPVDFWSVLGELQTIVVAGFALFPLVAIFNQFGWQKGMTAASLIFLTRLLVLKYTALFPEAIEIFVGMILFTALAIHHDWQNIMADDQESNSSESDSSFVGGSKELEQKLPLFAVVGALVAMACNLHIFAGSEVSIYTLAKAYNASDPGMMATLSTQAALSDLLRGLGFVPLIATTALATGVYGIVGLTFIYPIGYLAPNLLVAAIGGAVVISLEVLLLKSICNKLQKYPSLREASDNIRSAITAVMEFSLLIGSLVVVLKMGGYSGLLIGVIVYLANDSMGKPIINLAIGPVIIIITGILLNLAYYLQLFVPVLVKLTIS